MLHILLCISILLPCSQAFPHSNEDDSAEDHSDENSSEERSFEDDWNDDSWQVYIEHYYPCKDTVNHTTEEKVKKMQHFFHLPETGSPDSETIAIMHRPRCGVPDVLEYNRMSGNPKWEKNHLTYRINNYTPDLDQEKVVEAIEKAFKVWSDVTPLEFENVNEPADIEILFAKRAHGDFSPFDGKGGVLAHAYSPGSGIGGDCHFDEDEKWSETDKDINLFIVAAHEIGHSLGLDHSEELGALMYPMYSYMDPETFVLPDDDREGIQSIYGPNPKEDKSTKDLDNEDTDDHDFDYSDYYYKYFYSLFYRFLNRYKYTEGHEYPEEHEYPEQPEEDSKQHESSEEHEDPEEYEYPEQPEEDSKQHESSEQHEDPEEDEYPEQPEEDSKQHESSEQHEDPEEDEYPEQPEEDSK
ncbi:macrophage metalloelastase-like isoform X1 [Sphaerodactylus townsendi]|uniref:macrophage metalloelastase-like isoform X1 n=2 Tax=Sphaerodactylus townsendi TaxID=933632 RepID=UPI0020269B3E|nr:macrophage metalloelastase-like isoform X1 [Sphaerodactylus townsendi]